MVQSDIYESDCLNIFIFLFCILNWSHFQICNLLLVKENDSIISILHTILCISKFNENQKAG